MSQERNQRSSTSAQSEAAEAGASASETSAKDAAAIAAEGQACRQQPPDKEIDLDQIVEAILFASDSPLPAAKIARILDLDSARPIRACIERLNRRYEQMGAAFRIEHVAGGYQMLTLPKFQPWLSRLLRARQETRLSPAALETLAVIAYKQPVLRAEIEAIRGVSCGEVINRLREMGLVKIVGRADDVGRPLLYGTTKRFLQVFGLASLEDLPKVEELKPPAATETTPGGQGEPAGDDRGQ